MRTNEGAVNVQRPTRFPFLSFYFHYHLNVFNKVNGKSGSTIDDVTLGNCFMDFRLSRFLLFTMLASGGKSDFNHCCEERGKRHGQIELR